MLGLFVLDPVLPAGSGQPRIRFLHSCLRALSAATAGRLLVVRGDPRTVVADVARRVGAREVHVSAGFMPYGRRRDEAVRAARGDVALIATGSPYAVVPGRVTRNDGGHYAVWSRAGSTTGPGWASRRS